MEAHPIEQSFLKKIKTEAAVSSILTIVTQFNGTANPYAFGTGRHQWTRDGMARQNMQGSATASFEPLLRRPESEITLELKHMSDKSMDQAQADAALSDLVGAHNLVAEIAKHSNGYNNGRAKVAAELLEAIFQRFRHHCSKSVAEMLEKKLEANRIPAPK